MYYYFVWVRSSRYHGKDPLTYSSEQRLASGSIVEVGMQKDTVMGVISGPTGKPRFKTKAIERVFDLPPVPAHLLKLMSWIKDYYPAPLGIVTQQVVPAHFSEKQLKRSEDDNSLTATRRPSAELFVPIVEALSRLPPLTEQQVAALAGMEERNSYILHGTTGSGKTRLYIELAAKQLEADKSAIILTPEISLTSQLAENFRKIFGERVIVVHSGQTPAERQKAWLDALLATEPVVIIGPRSALFSPVQKLGLIVLDEAHETAYKQEQAPQYQTGRVAAYLAFLTRASLVLGSATPSVSDYYIAEAKQKPIIKLDKLAQEHDYANVSVKMVDRKDFSLFNRSPFLSQDMIKAVETALARGEQSLLYLNRRGTARLVMCENCGWQATCPHCDVPLTYHGDTHTLRCHSCDFKQPTPSACPDCGHASVLFKTAGTKAIFDEVQRLFPNARVMRFDTDNNKSERFEQHFEAVHKGEVDILVGTQLLAKGLDLPKLSTLGILLADTSLYMPDFSAQERTFQLISQVLGRIGRGHVAGTAVIQSYHPDHPVLIDAISGDYAKFYSREIADRKLFLFPPFCYMLKLTARRASAKAAESAAEKLRDEIQGHYKVRVEGPAPAFYERFQGKHQWQLVVKAMDRSELLRIIDHLPANWSYDIDPVDLL
ncbi:MAG: primosomal protein N' [Patescibacteria group bacterium]|nr:primosomal protein N' [Patescibacteria group bacterium]